MSFLRTMADRGDPRPVILVYAAKTWDDLTFREDLEKLQDELDLRIVHVLDEPPDDWEGASGFITPEILAEAVPKERFSRYYFICGPPPMMDAAHEAVTALEVPEAFIQMEKFNLA